MVLDIALLVILVFSFMEASIPVTKSTKMRNITAKITVAIGARNAASSKITLFRNPLNENESSIDCVYSFSMS